MSGLGSVGVGCVLEPVQADAVLPLTDDFVTVVCNPSQGKDGDCCVDEPLLSALFPNLSLCVWLLFTLGAATLDNSYLARGCDAIIFAKQLLARGRKI